MTHGRPPVALFDSPLMLAYKAGDGPTLDFVGRWVDASHPIVIGAPTAIRLVVSCRDLAERTEWERFVERVTAVLHVTAPTSTLAVQLVGLLPAPTELTADDVLVAATAVIQKLPLYALDPGRYAAVPGLTALPIR